MRLRLTLILSFLLLAGFVAVQVELAEHTVKGQSLDRPESLAPAAGAGSTERAPSAPPRASEASARDTEIPTTEVGGPDAVSRRHNDTHSDEYTGAP